MLNIKYSKYLLTPLLVFAMVFFIVLIYQYDNYMFGWEAKLRWGRKPYSTGDFKASKPTQRFQFTADIMSNNHFYGRPSDFVISELGSPDGGYYNYDSNLSYEIYNDEHTVWDLVFIINHETGTVESILIHKRCCAITRKWLALLLK
jgi:hypothetical protein